jgi:hypothetical protein
MTAIEGLHNLKYEENLGLEVFINKFNSLYSKIDARPGDEFSKVGYFKNSLEKSRSNPFRETLSHLNLQGFIGFDDIVNILYRKEFENRSKQDYRQLSQSKESAFEVDEETQPKKKRKIKKNAPQEVHVSNNNPTTSRPRYVCEHCGKQGHTKDRCFDIVPCPRCNKLGHSEKTCKYKGGTSLSRTVTVNGKPNGNSSGLSASKVKDNFVNKKLFKSKVS